MQKPVTVSGGRFELGMAYSSQNPRRTAQAGRGVELELLGGSTNLAVNVSLETLEQLQKFTY